MTDAEPLRAIQVLLDADAAIGVGLLEAARDSQTTDDVERHARDVLVAEEDLPGGGFQHPAHHVDQRGLASTVGADHSHHRPRLDLERNAFEDLQASEPLGDAFDTQSLRQCGPGSARREWWRPHSWPALATCGFDRSFVAGLRF